jgi:hypothetical protein
MNEGVVVEKSAAVSGTQQRPAPVGQISELFARFSVDHCPVRLHLPRQMSFTLELDTFLRPSIPEIQTVSLFNFIDETSCCICQPRR